MYYLPLIVLSDQNELSEKWQKVAESSNLPSITDKSGIALMYYFHWLEWCRQCIINSPKIVKKEIFQNSFFLIPDKGIIVPTKGGGP